MTSWANDLWRIFQSVFAFLTWGDGLIWVDWDWFCWSSLMFSGRDCGLHVTNHFHSLWIAEADCFCLRTSETDLFLLALDFWFVFVYLRLTLFSSSSTLMQWCPLSKYWCRGLLCLRLIPWPRNVEDWCCSVYLSEDSCSGSHCQRLMLWSAPRPRLMLRPLISLGLILRSCSSGIDAVVTNVTDWCCGLDLSKTDSVVSVCPWLMPWSLYVTDWCRGHYMLQSDAVVSICYRLIPWSCHVRKWFHASYLQWMKKGFQRTPMINMSPGCISRSQYLRGMHRLAGRTDLNDADLNLIFNKYCKNGAFNYYAFCRWVGHFPAKCFLKGAFGYRASCMWLVCPWERCCQNGAFNSHALSNWNGHFWDQSCKNDAFATHAFLVMKHSKCSEIQCLFPRRTKEEKPHHFAV